MPLRSIRPKDVEHRGTAAICQGNLSQQSEAESLPHNGLTQLNMTGIKFANIDADRQFRQRELSGFRTWRRRIRLGQSIQKDLRRNQLLNFNPAPQQSRSGPDQFDPRQSQPNSIDIRNC